MERLKRLFRQPAFHFWLFLLYLMIFTWPCLAIISLDRQNQVFAYIFANWIILVVLLYLVGRSIQDHPS